LFLFSLKSKESRLKYAQRINRFFDFIEIPSGDTAFRCKVFLEKGHEDSNYVLNRIIQFLQAQKEKIENKELASGTVRNYVNTIKLLCEVCEFPTPWKKILRGMPRGRKFASDRAPTIEEIRKIIEYPDRRIKCIVFTMASSGIRLGAWDYLKWGHMKPIYENGEVTAAKMRVYADEDEEYFTFISTEAYSSLLDWMNFRKESEPINDEFWK
jgi:integrase